MSDLQASETFAGPTDLSIFYLDKTLLLRQHVSTAQSHGARSYTQTFDQG